MSTEGLLATGYWLLARTETNLYSGQKPVASGPFRLF